LLFIINSKITRMKGLEVVLLLLLHVL